MTEGNSFLYFNKTIVKFCIKTLLYVVIAYFLLQFGDRTIFPFAKKIAYVTREEDALDIWIMDRNGRNKRRLTHGISGGNWGDRFSSIKIEETAGYYHLSWHPDGTKIAFTGWEKEKKESYISILEFKKGVLDRLTVGADSIPEEDTLIRELELASGKWEDFAPYFSPDGDKIVFTSNRKGNWDIWIVKSDGTNLQRITTGDTPHWNPAFSSNGKKVAYTTADPDDEVGALHHGSNYNIWIADLETGEEMMVTGEEQTDWNPVWSPDGKKIAYVTKRSGDDLSHFNIWMLYLQ